jgi:hypothetical protein
MAFLLAQRCTLASLREITATQTQPIKPAHGGGHGEGGSGSVQCQIRREVSQKTEKAMKKQSAN